MRYTTGKMKGELKTPEIRKLIKAHNKLVSINIPKGAKREDIMKIVTKAGYMVDHEKGELRPVSKGKVKKLPVVTQKSVQKTLPKPKTAEEKKKAKLMRDKKKEVTETKAYEKRKGQVDAIKKIQQRRKKGQMGKVDPDKIPEFDNYKKLETYFNTQTDKFIKEVRKESAKAKAITDPKALVKVRNELNKKSKKKIIAILDTNEEFIEDEKGEDAYEELESRFEKKYKVAIGGLTERILELKGK